MVEINVTGRVETNGIQLFKAFRVYDIVKYRMGKTSPKSSVMAAGKDT